VAAVNAVVLAVIVLLSAVPYVGSLGFYSDDWALLSGFEAVAATGGSAIAHGFQAFDARPVHGAYLAMLFELFGREPLGYHLVNTAVIAACAPLLYLLLRRLGVSGAAAFASALLFVLLPQLSTVRVWYAAFQVPLSMAAALLSMHAQLSFARSARVGWLLAAAVVSLVSIAAYETFAPLIAGFAAGLWYVNRSDPSSSAEPRSNRKLAALGAVVAVIVLATLAKVLLSDRTGDVTDLSRYLLGARQLIRLDYDWRIDSGLNLVAAGSVHFLHTLRGWAAAAAALFAEASAATLVVTAAIAVLAYWRLSVPDRDAPTGATARHLLMLGLATFALGHATFLIVPWITFAPTGMGNRTLVAAAVGVALILVACISLALRAVPGRYRSAAFSTAVVVLASVAVARLQQIERYWAEAPDLQRQVMKLAREDLRDIAAGSTILLDGVCPYHGPAVVFETYWDTGPALSLALGKQVEGDAVSSRMQLTTRGVETSIYEQPRLHAYGPKLLVYNPASRSVVQLTDSIAAQRYFSGSGRARARCPASYVARGVPI
jgi:hypothetical protein